MKGYFSVEGLIALVITLVMWLSLYPFVNNLIVTAVPTMDTYSAGFLILIPAVWTFVLLISILSYLPGSGRR